MGEQGANGQAFDWREGRWNRCMEGEMVVQISVEMFLIVMLMAFILGLLTALSLLGGRYR